MPKTVDELASRWLPDASLGDSERRVLGSAVSRKTLARDMNEHYERNATRGGRLADRIATIGGSWSFIVVFLMFLLVWTVGNGWLLSRDAFDPYPFVFLNLMLSMMAAIQAPIIMMSQNRQAARDRADATHDYEVNLKAEIEIMALHEKMDALRHREIGAIHGDISAIARNIERLEQKLAGTDFQP